VGTQSTEVISLLNKAGVKAYLDDFKNTINRIEKKLEKKKK